MAFRVLVDSGPIVALLNRRDKHHEWATGEITHLREPLLTCEAVISEVFFLLSRIRGGHSVFIALLRDGLVVAAPHFTYADHSAEILRHMERFANLPMSFADACLVRMSEIEPGSIVFTTDKDFLTYRRHRRQAIPLISPF
jgi:uncharacterized protein